MTSDLKNIKILFLVKTMDVGGAERFTLNLAKHFAARTKGVTVASSGGIFVDELRKNGIKHIRLNNRPEIINIIPLYYELKRIIKEDDYTIIHCQHRIFTFLVQLIWKRKFFLLYTAHNVFNDLFQKIIFPDLAIAVSHTIKLNLLKTFYISKNKINQINNGVGIPDNKKSVSKVLTIGFIGRLIKEKGIFNLLEAVKILTEKRSDFRLIIRGKGETEKISEYIRLNNLNNLVSIALVSNVEKEIYMSIDILILPTKMNEGLPLSILEAAARGILVVSTKEGGIEDFIDNRKTGILLDSVEPKQLADSIEDIIENYNSYSGIIENARNKVINDFSIDQMTVKYEELYSKTLQNTTSR